MSLLCRDCKARLKINSDSIWCTECSYARIQKDRDSYKGTVNPKYLKRGSISNTGTATTFECTVRVRT